MSESRERQPAVESSALRPLPSQLRIELCGPFRVYVDGLQVGDVAFRRAKIRAALSLLALAPQLQLRREQWADALWPELDGDGAANQLAKAIHVLRRVFEPELGPRVPSRFLVSHEGVVQLQAPGGVTVDALEFRDAARFGIAAGTSPALDSAIALLPDELLQEFLDEPWTISLREELRRLHSRVLERAAELSEQSDAVDRADRLWQQLLAIDPASEVAYRGLIRGAVRRGDRSGANRLLGACREVLRRELDVEPDASTVAIALSGTPETSIGVSSEQVGTTALQDVQVARLAPRQAPFRGLNENAFAENAPMGWRGAVFARKTVRFTLSLPHALQIAGGARWQWIRTVATLLVISMLTVLFIATTPAGRSVQRATRKNVRAVVSMLTGEPADPMIIVLAGSGVAPRARVDVVGSRSGLATYADEEGRFALPGVAWRPGQMYQVAVSLDENIAAVTSVSTRSFPAANGVLDIGQLPPPNQSVTLLESVAGLNSFAVVSLDGDAYLAGVVRAVTVTSTTDADRVKAIDAFVASLYDATSRERRSVSDRVSLGSGSAGELNETMAVLTSVAGYRTRLVDVGDPDHPGLTYPLVEVMFEGSWHVFDPASATEFRNVDGGVPSFAEARLSPEDVRIGEAGRLRPWTAEWLRRVYGSPLHRYREVGESGTIEG